MDHRSNKPTDETSKVINLFANRKQLNDAIQTDSREEPQSEEAFNEAVRKNMENAERLRKERLKANQGVLKSYKIKN